jgi:hypothetical protein
LLSGGDWEFGCGIVLQPLAQGGEHFVRGFAGSADDENEAKLLLVAVVERGK